MVLLIAVFVAMGSWPAVSQLGPGRFMDGEGWYPTAGRFDLLPMVWGTLAATAGAVVLAGPVGVLAAVFLRWYAPRGRWRGVEPVLRRVVELLAGVPSVVYGLWGLVVLVPLVRELHPPGQSLIAGVLVLAVMIVPTVTLFADAALAAVPAELGRSAAALGMSRGATVLGVALPAARGGIAVGVLLATGRALGETMAVLMVCGNVVQTPSSPFDPIRTLTANIALEMGYAYGDHRSALFVTGLLLLAMAAALVAAVEMIGGRVTRAI